MMGLLALTIAVLVGAQLVVQTGANVQLARVLGAPPRAAAMQLGVAAVLLAAAVTISGDWSAVQAMTTAPTWELGAGLASAAYVGAGIVLIPRIGAVFTVALFVAGQMAASMLIDIWGFAAVPAADLSVWRVLGAVAIVAAVWGIARQSQVADGGRSGAWLPLLGILAGAGLPLQAAINADLHDRVDAALPVAFVSFVVAAVAVATLSMVRRTAVAPRQPAPWWAWIGGFLGATYVTVMFVLVPQLGAAATVALTVAGQQLASAVVDHFGALRLPRRPLTWSRAGMILLLLAGVALIKL